MSDDDRDNDIESDADKRAHHNALERKRRDHIKDSFSMLRDALPFFQGDKASRAQILKKAADYITTMRRKNIAHQQDIDDLKKQNKALEEQIRLLEKARTSDNINSTTAAIESAKVTLKNLGSGYHSPDYGDTSESDDSSDNSHDSNDNPRKRLKTSTDPSRI